MAEKTVQLIMAARGSWEVPVAGTNVLNFVSNPPGNEGRNYYKFFQRLRYVSETCPSSIPSRKNLI